MEEFLRILEEFEEIEAAFGEAEAGGGFFDEARDVEKIERETFAENNTLDVLREVSEISESFEKSEVFGRYTSVKESERVFESAVVIGGNAFDSVGGGRVDENSGYRRELEDTAYGSADGSVGSGGGVIERAIYENEKVLESVVFNNERVSESAERVFGDNVSDYERVIGGENFFDSFSATERFSEKERVFDSSEIYECSDALEMQGVYENFDASGTIREKVFENSQKDNFESVLSETKSEIFNGGGGETGGKGGVNINVNFNAYNEINSEADVDIILERFAEKLAETVAAASEGVHL